MSRSPGVGGDFQGGSAKKNSIKRSLRAGRCHTTAALMFLREFGSRARMLVISFMVPAGWVSSGSEKEKRESRKSLNAHPGASE